MFYKGIKAYSTVTYFNFYPFVFCITMIIPENHQSILYMHQRIDFAHRQGLR